MGGSGPPAPLAPLRAQLEQLQGLECEAQAARLTQMVKGRAAADGDEVIGREVVQVQLPGEVTLGGVEVPPPES